MRNPYQIFTTLSMFDGKSPTISGETGAEDTLLHLQRLQHGQGLLPWPCRVRRLRAALQRVPAPDLASLVAAVRGFVELLEGRLGCGPAASG